MHSGLLQERNHHTQIAVWLLLCCALIFTMVVVGGVTRLTRSGLSMVEWDPIMGVIPPLGQSQWEETFHKYQQFPEYVQVNRDMTMSEFKFIYWMEYAHRLLGRGIGLAFLLPFLYFIFRRRIERSLIPKLVAMFLLGGLQGLLGWFMVKSGLIDMPRVSPYRLTAHLILAVIIYGYILWVALGLLFPDPENRNPSARPPRRLAHATTMLIVVMIASGGFVAGTKAGFAFITFPLMNGRLIPEGLLAMRPMWTNFFENVATVQFDHRKNQVRLTAHLILAVIIYGYILWVALGLLFPDPENRNPSARPPRRLAHATTMLIVVMIASGGFVAGTKAGFAFITFPLMNGRLIPEGLLAMRPVWTNFFENVATVQFDHRIIAYLLCLVVPWLWYRAAKAPLHARARLASHALLGMLVVQVSLGIATLLLVVPVALAAAHQAGAILFFTIALFVNHELRRGREPTLKWHTSTSSRWAG